MFKIAHLQIITPQQYDETQFGQYVLVTAPLFVLLRCNMTKRSQNNLEDISV